MSETVGELVAAARGDLARAPFEAPGREALLILGRVLGWSEAQVLARSRETVPAAAARRFRDLLGRRLRGEPVAYLFGEREFYGRPFRVDPRVLIPRPETEHLIEAALELDLPPAPRILDLGTGSGCIALTLALEIPGALVTAVDLSPGALAVAADNARRLGARARLAAADLAGALDVSRFDLVVANPPYIDPAEAGGLSPEVRDYEPGLALFGPGAGESILRRILKLGRNLHVGARVMMEIGQGQIGRLREEIESSSLSLLEVRRDYAGIPRLVVLIRDLSEDP